MADNPSTRLFRTLVTWIPVLLLLLLLTPTPVPAQPPEPDAAGGGRHVSIDFNNVDIRVFIKFISELTGKNFIIDDRVKGKVTVISPEKITLEEAYRVFESVLEVHGFTTVPSGKVIKVVSSPEARTKSIETRLLEDALSPEDTVVTRIISLKFAEPEEVRKLFTPLISKSSVMLAYSPTGMLVVTDVASNIQRLMRILDVIDVPGIGQQISVVHLEHADAEKIAKIVGVIFKETAQKGRRTASTSEIVMAADERTNTLILRGSEDDTHRIKDLIALLDRKTPRDKGNIRVFYLENASAEDLAKVLMDLPGETSSKAKGAPAPAVSGDVKITADKATNSLIIQADKEDYQILEEIIAKLDIPRSMVYIECLIMEVNVEKAFQIGVEWKAGGTTDIGDNNSIFGGGFSGSDYSSLNRAYSAGTLPNGMSMGIFGDVITIGGVSFPNIAAVIEAYKSDEDVQIISTPQILTTDNEEAKIYIGKNVPFKTKATTTSDGTGEVYNSFEYKDVGTTLKITPQISQDRMVRLNISQEVSKLESLVDEKPTTLKRTIETTVIVQDQATVVIGGLIDENNAVTENKVPLLGDIPILGWLFRSKAKSYDKSNLFVFLTPRVIKSPAEAGAVYRQKQGVIDRLRKAAQARKADSGMGAPSPEANPIKLYNGDESGARNQPAAP